MVQTPVLIEKSRKNRVLSEYVILSCREIMYIFNHDDYNLIIMTNGHNQWKGETKTRKNGASLIHHTSLAQNPDLYFVRCIETKCLTLNARSTWTPAFWASSATTCLRERLKIFYNSGYYCHHYYMRRIASMRATAE